MVIPNPRFSGELPIPLQLNLPLLRQAAELLKLLIHGVVQRPPAAVGVVAGVNALIGDVPIAVVIPVTHPRLQP